MDSAVEKTSPSSSSYHHQRAPRTPESYFNVPESIALLNIVKSERIQSAFQSNRKNHASVWEMVAEVLNRFSTRKRSAKQCCNRYENLKKIYTQLKKNPERHVRRNWPYMFLFKEIEEQRGECWGSNGKRLALITKNHKELSYYHRRRQAAELSLLLGKDGTGIPAHVGLMPLNVPGGQAPGGVGLSINVGGPPPGLAHSNDSNSPNCKLDRYLQPNHFVEAQLNDSGEFDDAPPPPMQQMPNLLRGPSASLDHVDEAAKRHHEALGLTPIAGNVGGGDARLLNGSSSVENNNSNNSNGVRGGGIHVAAMASQSMMNCANGLKLNNNNNNSSNSHHHQPGRAEYEKDCNGALNLQTNENNISMKSEPLSEGEFNPDDIQLMQTNYNGSQNFYPHNIDPNILHPDVIVDTDNLSDCSSSSIKSKRKLSTSTDGGDSTNYELIEYLKRREKRDEEMLKRMDAREERLISLLERTVVAIELLANRPMCGNAIAENHSSSPPSTSTIVNGSSDASSSESSEKVGA